MNLKKAKKILTLMGTPEFEGHTEDILAARLLGIEGLKLVQAIRNQTKVRIWELLPGETKD